MLILTRREGESIVICDDIEVTVRRVRGNPISLGIDAPRDVDIVREELLEREPTEPA